MDFMELIKMFLSRLHFALIYECPRISDFLKDSDKKFLPFLNMILIVLFAHITLVSTDTQFKNESENFA